MYVAQRPRPAEVGTWAPGNEEGMTAGRESSKGRMRIAVSCVVGCGAPSAVAGLA
jgi:hypothetical protein